MKSLINRLNPLSHSLPLAAAITILLCAAWMQVSLCFAGDRGWLLLAAQMCLKGKTLYHDIFESNPPLILWIYDIPSFIALHTGLEDYQLLGLMTLCVMAVSITISARIIAYHPFFAGNRMRLALFALLLTGVNILCTYAPAAFADRDYIFQLCVLPYILRFMPSLSDSPVSRKSRLLLGFLAGLGFCIKPHCLILLVGINVLNFAKLRSARALYSLENFCVLTFILIYMCSILLFTSEYVHIVLPMALATYAAYSVKKGSIGFVFIALLTSGITFADFRLRYQSPLRQDIFYLIGVSALMLLYALSNNGWGYTYIPLYNMLIILNGFVLWEHLYLKRLHQDQGLPYKSFLFGARACIINWAANTLIGFATICYGYYVMQTGAPCLPSSPDCTMTGAMENSIHKYHASSFGAITMDFILWYPVVKDTGAHLQTRFNHLWMLPELITQRNASTQQNAWISEYIGRGLTEDITTYSPDIFFVDSSPYIFPTKIHLNIPEYIGAHFAPFKSVWANYHYAETINQCPYAEEKFACSYDIYVRNKP